MMLRRHSTSEPTKPRPVGSLSAWLWVAAILSLLICLLIIGVYHYQRRILGDSIDRLEALFQTRLAAARPTTEQVTPALRSEMQLVFVRFERGVDTLDRQIHADLYQTSGRIDSLFMWSTMTASLLLAAICGTVLGSGAAGLPSKQHSAPARRASTRRSTACSKASRSSASTGTTSMSTTVRRGRGTERNRCCLARH
jgi:hypothetical protein